MLCFKASGTFEYLFKSFVLGIIFIYILYIFFYIKSVWEYFWNLTCLWIPKCVLVVGGYSFNNGGQCEIK